MLKCVCVFFNPARLDLLCACAHYPFAKAHTHCLRGVHREMSMGCRCLQVRHVEHQKCSWGSIGDPQMKQPQWSTVGFPVGVLIVVNRIHIPLIYLVLSLGFCSPSLSCSSPLHHNCVTHLIVLGKARKKWIPLAVFCLVGKVRHSNIFTFPYERNSTLRTYSLDQVQSNVV